jgi:hypothetical protein
MTTLQLSRALLSSRASFSSRAIFSRAVLVALIALTAASCGGRRARIEARRNEQLNRQLVQTASRQTGCPPGTLTPQQIADAPPVYTVTGCTTPIEYWLQCSGRGNRNCDWRNVALLNEAAAMPLGCPPQGIQQQLTAAPNMRYATGCGRTAAFTIACNGAACGWAQSSPVQGGTGVAVQQPQQPQQFPMQPQAQTPNAAIQAQVQMHREAILSCLDEGSITLSFRWTADGQVLVQLPTNLQGSAAEGCINAVLGAIRVSASQPGEMSVPVQ